jgi:hypothetical protein
MDELPPLTRGVAITGTDRDTAARALAAAYLGGATIIELAKQTGRSRTWIAECLTLAGVTRRPRGRQPKHPKQETTS